ncbi:MAG: hypothetical protein JSV05_05895 [Candidatus Bathyarchaeota archaeon]|nr:MAG: hypothetical protein JSV05_05895 [Candidatus Bathyarchaeota archaeon]
MDRKLLIELVIASIAGLLLGVLAGFAGARAGGVLEMIGYLLLWVLSILGIFLLLVLIVALVGERFKVKKTNFFRCV